MAEYALFDLNGTLLDPSPLGEPLEGNANFVADVLDDAVRLAMIATITDSYCDFSALLEAAARGRLQAAGRAELLDDVMAGASRMKPFPDASRQSRSFAAPATESASSPTAPPRPRES